MPPPAPDWQRTRDLFEVPGSRVYILGCFARHVTIYSQQVRALNFILSLRETRVLTPGTKVAVVGGGAAGLMAAVAAAHFEAEVTLIDRLDGPMELQRNNRQRWIHPYLYDWPFTDREGDCTRLPFLNWQAAYAASVAEQIEAGWRKLVSTFRYPIQDHWRVGNTRVSPHDHSVTVTWTTREGNGRPFGAPSSEYDLAILAVGFGLEPDKPAEGSWSYWSEDPIDGDFRHDENTTTHWLVSGVGDGALTDVMRLCIRRFRHHEIAGLLSAVNGFNEFKERLKDLHPPHEELPAAKVHKDFEAALNDLKGFDHVLREGGRLRRGVEVHLAMKTQELFGPSSSLLNRVIVGQLLREGRLQPLPGALKRVRQGKGGEFLVKRHDGGRPKPYHHVIRRHGPTPAIDEFDHILDLCKANGRKPSMKEQWQQMGINRDFTRVPMWSEGVEYPLPSRDIAPQLQSATLAALELAQAPALGQALPGALVPAPMPAELPTLPVSASTLLLSKELRSDGSSQMYIRVEGLSVREGELRGFHFRMKSTVGILGDLALDEDAQRLGMTLEPGTPTTSWVQDGPPVFSKLSQTAYFQKPLRPEDPPVSFGFRVSSWNSEAMTAWQFEQMYREDDRKHMDKSSIQDVEFVSRVVWFPVETLRLRLTLPPEIPSAPTVNLFVARQPVTRDVVVSREGILELYPPESWTQQLPPEASPWQRAADDALTQAGRLLKSPTPQSWEINVPNPPAGSCYSLDWQLPRLEVPPAAEFLLARAARVRQKCVEHGRARRFGQQGHPGIRAAFARLETRLLDVFGVPGTANHGIEISFMTLNPELNRLEMVEASLGGSDQMDLALGRFNLPFGLGLAGAAFKEGHIFQYKKPPEVVTSRPGLYLLVPEQTGLHDVLVATPLDLPDLQVLQLQKPDEMLRERSRQCVGVVNLGSQHPSQRMRLTEEQDRDFLIQTCSNFAADLVSNTSEG